MLPPNIKPRDIGIYFRTSTLKQQIAVTIKMQRDFTKHWLYPHGINMSDCHIYEDDGVSSSLFISRNQRTAGSRLLADCEAKLIRYLLVYDVGRLAREAHDFHALEIKLRELGVVIVSMTTNADSSTPDGKRRMGFDVIFAEWEKDKIRKRTTHGREGKAREGKHTGGGVPYGYKVFNEYLVIKEPEASFVRTIFELYLKHKQSKPVCKELETRDILSPSGKKKWHAATVLRILRRSAYRGIRKYNKRSERDTIEAACPAIVSNQKWERVQMIIDGNRSTFRSFNTQQPFILANMLHCAYCGGAYLGVTERKVFKTGPAILRYYSHTSASVSKKCTLPRRPWIRTSIIEDMVWDEVLGWVQSPGDIIEELQHDLQQKTHQPDALAKLRNELKQAKARNKRVVNLLIDQLIDEEDAKEQLEATKESIKRIEEQIDDKMALIESEEAAKKHLASTQSLLDSLYQSALEADELTKLEIFRILIDDVDVFFDTQGKKQGGKVSVDIHSCMW